MKLLFLDTETTGFEPQKDQIIEVGAVIYELTNQYQLKVVSTFQTTIALRGQMDERITRITGITELELASAPTLLKAQKLWLDWLELPQNLDIKAVIGHSIDFDIGFLNKENWYLPTQTTVDTLDLAKIFCPDAQAINLEFLAKYMAFSEKLDGINMTGMSYHRALYDTVMCANLFEVLIQKLANLHVSQNFADQVVTNFLPIPIIFYKTQPKQNNKQNLTQNSIQTQIISITGQVKSQNINDKLQNLFVSEQLVEMLIWKTTKDQKMVILQLVIIATQNQTNDFNSFKTFLKLHTMGQSLKFAEFTLDLLLSYNVPQNPTLEHTPQTIFANPENILDNVAKVYDQTCNFAELVDLLELYNNFFVTQNQSNQEIINILSKYDFFLLTLNNHLTNYEYKLNFFDIPAKDRQMIDKYINLVESLHSLVLPTTDDLECYKVADLVANKIITLQKQFVINRNKKYHFKLNGNKGLSVSTNKDNFDLYQHFVNILDANLNTITQTNLSQEDFKDLLYLAQVDDLDFGVVEYTQTCDYNVISGVSALDYFSEKIELAKAQNGVVFIACGLNSSIKNAEQICTRYDMMKDVLIIGESGGITKIASKIDQGFVGIVVIKFGNMEYFDYLTKKPNTAQVVLYDKPYFFIHDFWYNLSKQPTPENTTPDQYLKELKNLFVQGKINHFHKTLNCPVELIYNLIG